MIERLVITFIVCFSIGMIVSSAMAGGGKVKNPVIVDDDQCVMDISGIDLEDCPKTPAPDQSGFDAFNCGVIVLCPKDE